MSGMQPGSPERAGEAMIAIARNAEAPRHLVLGAWGFNTVVDYLQKLTKDIESKRSFNHVPQRLGAADSAHGMSAA
jgi:hypothetical protein